MPRDVAAPAGLHKSPHRQPPPLQGGRRPRPARKRAPPRPHPIRRIVAGGILLAKPWQVATGTILAHLRGLHRRIRRTRGSATARRVISALIHRIVSRVPVDLRGSPLQLLAQLGIEVSDRAAREAVRVLARLSVIVRLGSDHTPSRIRLLAAHRAAVARAETARITPAIFAPDAELLGREPEQLWLRTANGQRMAGCGADSDSPAAIRNARPEDSQNHDTLSSWIRSLPAGRWIRLAADLLARRGDRVGHALHLTTAHARALLLADGRPAGYRDTASLLRALNWLAARGDLEIRDGDLLPKARRHPDLEALNIDAPPSAEQASKAMQAHLDRCGVHRSDLLGREEARRLSCSSWWRRQHESRLGLADCRKLLTGSARPGPGYAHAIATAPERLKVQARFMRRDGFSAEMRRRAGEHSSAGAVSPDDAQTRGRDGDGGEGVHVPSARDVVRHPPWVPCSAAGSAAGRSPAGTHAELDGPNWRGGMCMTVHCGSPAALVPSAGGRAEHPGHARHGGGPRGAGGPGQVGEVDLVDPAGARLRRLPAVPPLDARRRGGASVPLAVPRAGPGPAPQHHRRR